MASIYSDEMKEKILTDFSSKNPKISASIIERFGDNSRNKGLRSLNVEEYRNAIDAPLYARNGTSGGINEALQQMILGEISPQEYQELMSTLSESSDVIDYTPTVSDTPSPEAPKETGGMANKLSAGADIAQGIAALVNMFSAGKYDEAPGKAPKYRAPKPTEIKGVGGIGMAYGGIPRRYEKGSEGGVQDPILENPADPGLIETLRFLGLSDEAIVNFVNTVGDIPEGVVDSAIFLGQKARDAGLLEDPRNPDNGMNDGGTVLNRKLFLGGGEVDGIGGPKSDLVPIWASDQEYVVSANGVKRMGGGNHARGIAALDEINNNGRLV